ncbi:DUF805 domain-containing protein [Methyloferula stellata]|uniref:DUF805 domain-containing protein n=1 Tax=Methyloferula stellata TaxID=876270 RepID=UPI00035D2309|nr:DUF805 domain-containing protein [Methyloferula stellata]
MDLIPILFSITGRLDRGRFWRAVLVSICAWILIFLVAAGIAFIFGAQRAVLNAGILPLLVSTPIGIRRLHDRDKSGRWLVVFYGLPLLFGYIADTTDIGVEFLLSLASTAIAIWGFIELGCLRGTEGPNRFGPDPLAS